MSGCALVVHGGAWYVPPRLEAAFREGCRRAAEAGWDVLQRGGSALDAVETAVRLLEEDPTFNAGRGIYYNQVGELELDAIIMDGRTLRFGAVAAVQHVLHPISLARLVMERTPHHMLVGAGAERFAQAQGFPLCDAAELLGKVDDPHSDEYWSPLEPPSGDTVGAVARDREGNVAVATSTGGTPNKLPGRVGDSPLVGCGAYADNACGAAGTTGWGEPLMRIVASKTACDFLRQGMDAQEAAEALIELLYRRVGGYGGIIIVDRNGRIGMAHNTPHMAYACISETFPLTAGVKVGGG